MRPSRDATAFKAGAGPFRRTLSSKHRSRAEAAGLEPGWAVFATLWLSRPAPVPAGLCFR